MNIYAVTGLPGSGKSTKAAELQSKFGGIILSAESMLKHGGKPLLSRETVYHANRLVIFLSAQAVSAGITDVIVDDCNANKDHLESLRKLAEISGGKFTVVKSDAPWADNIEECLKKTSMPLSTTEMLEIKRALSL